MGPVLDWLTITDTDAVLKTIALDDLWGISRRWKDKLNQIGIHHALALKQSDPKFLRQHFGVVMERIVTELAS
jgi:DNA polymerase V